MSEGDKDTTAPRSWSAFFENKFTLMVAGFVLTTVIGAFLNERIQQARWETETEFKVFQNQLKDADSVQSEILSEMGQMRKFLNRARRLGNDAVVDPDAPTESLIEAKDYFENVMEPYFQTLASKMHMRRNQMALIFGPVAADKLLTRRDNVLHLDNCSVLVLDSDSNLHVDCKNRRRAEAIALTKNEGARMMESYYHSVRIAQFLIKRTIWCKDPREDFPAKATKCDDLKNLQIVTNRRYVMTGNAMNDLVDVIFDVMVGLNAKVR